MSTHSQFVALREVLSCTIDARRGDIEARARLSLVARAALEADVPPSMLLPVGAIARGIASEGFFQALPPEIADRAAVVRANEECLDQLGRRLEAVNHPTDQAVLLGDAGLLVLLYDDLAAFPLRLPILGVRGPRESRGLIEAHLHHQGGRATIGPLGMLADPVRRTAPTRNLGGHTWTLPSRELIVALLTSRVGDPLAHPDPALWHHLALAFGLWRGELDCERILTYAMRVGLCSPLRRGVALLAHLFPQLEIPAALRGAKPALLERALAVPLAARKLVALSLASDTARESAWALSVPSLQVS
jgi:hypothetical protein